MEQALYDPEWGYYEREQTQTGPSGDFYTNVNVGPVFGRLLAARFAAWLDAMPGEDGLRLIEAGAHDGRLAGDVLAALARSRPDLIERIEYWIIEPSPRRRNRQAWLGARFAGRIQWIQSWNDVAERSVAGIIFSNELLDAFPVHRIGWDGSARRWFEWGVAESHGQFVWSRMPESGGPLSSASYPVLPDALAAVLPDRFTTEVCPQAWSWWAQAARRLRRGWLLTIDYGFEEVDFFAPNRLWGTLRGYSKHRTTEDLLANPGEQDITAHVNFSRLAGAGANGGLSGDSLVPQERFLVRILRDFCGGPAELDGWTESEIRQFQTLTHPEQLGRPFRVLIQSRKS
jgi:SAM-dependent MidA family methyltransferase